MQNVWEIATSECYSDLDLVYLKLLHLSLGTKSVQKLGLCLGIALGNACFKYCQPGFSLLSLIIFYQTLAKYTSSMLFELLPLQNNAVKYLCSNVDCHSAVTWFFLSKVVAIFGKHWEKVTCLVLPVSSYWNALVVHLWELTLLCVLLPQLLLDLALNMLAQLLQNIIHTSWSPSYTWKYKYLQI